MQPIFKILIVDDHPANLMALESMLDSPNRTFLKATSGNEALAVALKTEDIGLIMLDVQMPEMDGFEVAGYLRSNPRTRDIAIVFVTAISKTEEHMLRGFKEGAIDYLQKPLSVPITKAKVAVFERLYFYQKELKKTIAEKERVNKQLESFSYIVAHDLKSPLTGIIALVSFIQEDERIRKMEDISEYLNLLTEASGHASAMISAILNYTVKGNSETDREEVNVGELLSQLILLLFPPKHFKISLEGQFPTFVTNKLKLKQVFQNLLSNAIKYNDKKNPEITISSKDKGDCYLFSIQDNGMGIPEKDHTRIFALFQTSSNKSTADSSTGIGLNIIKLLVQEQGGKIWLNSKVGHGTTFYFEWKKH